LDLDNGNFSAKYRKYLIKKISICFHKLCFLVSMLFCLYIIHFQGC
jgi:hypothetical protein